MCHVYDIVWCHVIMVSLYQAPYMCALPSGKKEEEEEKEEEEKEEEKEI